ncbi:MAG: response regulator transcription factor [Ignavibacteriales bacterium]|nr:response regulator transcription factor [Ignavibacteriales bacterium]
MRILVIEDEKKVAKFIKRGLEEEHYAVDVVHDGESGLQLGKTEPYDLLVVDIMIPKKDGITVIKELRSKKITIPILILTAKTTVEERVAGLDAGADDYLTKPFAMEELFARIRSLLRRGAAEKTPMLRIGDLELDLVSHKAKRADKMIELTAKEYGLLEYFMRNKNRVLSRTLISEHIWNYNFDTGTNIIDVYVNHLRQKVDNGFEKNLIHTVRGVGYMMKDSE